VDGGWCGVLHTMLLLSCENRFSAQRELCNIRWAEANSRGCHVVEVVESTRGLELRLSGLVIGELGFYRRKRYVVGAIQSWFGSKKDWRPLRKCW